LESNFEAVDALATTVHQDWDQPLVVADYLKRVLLRKCWRTFSPRPGVSIEHVDGFATCVVAPRPWGLGADVAGLRQLVADDDEATILLDADLRVPPGEPIGRVTLTEIGIGGVPWELTGDSAESLRPSPALLAELDTWGEVTVP
jgi:hypothetical protein